MSNSLSCRVRALLFAAAFLAMKFAPCHAEATSTGMTVLPPSVEVNLNALDELQQTPAVTVRSAPPVAPPIAVSDTPVSTAGNTGYVEAGGDYHSVTHNQNWHGEYLNGAITTDPANTWNAELLNQNEFGDHGVYGSVGNTHIFNPDWYSVVDVGGATGGIFLPSYRVDAFINRKWLDQRQWVTTLGVGEYKAMDAHHDQSVFLGGTYYFQTIPWIVQGGIRFDNSDPGSVNSTSQFIAVTEGEDKKHFITLRFGFGKEAYELIDADQTLSDFYSQEISLDVKEWVGSDWGFHVRGEAYHNPYYDRVGFISGVFKEF